MLTLFYISSLQNSHIKRYSKWFGHIFGNSQEQYVTSWHTNQMRKMNGILSVTSIWANQCLLLYRFGIALYYERMHKRSSESNTSIMYAACYLFADVWLQTTRILFLSCTVHVVAARKVNNEMFRICIGLFFFKLKQRYTNWWQLYSKKITNSDGVGKTRI